jgi:hypothetical protein
MLLEPPEATIGARDCCFGSCDSITRLPSSNRFKAAFFVAHFEQILYYLIAPNACDNNLVPQVR